MENYEQSCGHCYCYLSSADDYLMNLGTMKNYLLLVGHTVAVVLDANHYFRNYENLGDLDDGTDGNQHIEDFVVVIATDGRHLGGVVAGYHLGKD